MSLLVTVAHLETLIRHHRTSLGRTVYGSSTWYAHLKAASDLTRQWRLAGGLLKGVR